jgi:predicted kinase
MPKLIMMQGLPGSGKTTYAKKLVEQGYKRISKDDLREMLDNGAYTSDNERIMLEVQDSITIKLMSKDCNIVIDGCNFNPYHEGHLAHIAELNDYEFEIKYLDTPLEECILRDSKREKPLGKKVIKYMYEQYLK